MSSYNDPSAVQSLAAEWPIFLLGNQMWLSCALLLYYDFFLTLPQEINQIWTAKFSGAKFLFLLNRYPALLGNTLNIAYPFYPTHSDKARCNILGHVAIALPVCSVVANVGILTLRTFAIYQKNYLVLFGLGSVGLGSLITYFWYAFGESSSYAMTAGPFVCSLTPVNDQKLILANYILNIIFDSLVFFLTFFRTIGLAIDTKKMKVKSNFVFMFLRDGTVYYLTLLMINVAVICVLQIPNVPEQWPVVIEPLSQIMDIILTSRLVLNLRSVHQKSQDESMKTTLPDINFISNPVLGNLGEPLDHDDGFDSSFYLTDIVEIETNTNSKEQSTLGA